MTKSLNLALLRTRSVAAAGVLTICMLAATSSFAGDCPADKVGVDVTPPGPMAPVGVTDTVIASIDLGDQYQNFDGHVMRMRRLVIEPGGIVPWHNHAERPANIYVVSGTVTEYRSTCAVPIVHPAGDVTAESGDLSHWWKNNGTEPAILISADILTEDAKTDPMKQGTMRRLFSKFRNRA